MGTSLQRVVWSEGMLMTPQHFQHQDRYHEALLDARLRWLSPDTVGVAEFLLDELALSEGRIALTRFHGVLPGGTVLRMHEGVAELPPPRSVGERPRAGDALAIYLGLARARTGGGTYARTAAESKRARYLMQSHLVADAVSAAEETSIELAHRNAVILLGEEADDDYDAIKLAEVVRTADGALRYADGYVPTCLRLRASSALVDLVRRVRAACIARLESLSAALRQRDASNEFASDEVTRYLALHAISGVLPLLTQQLDDRDVSPRAVYTTLLGFAGQLSAFDVMDDPSVVPPYRPDDLRGTFEALATRILGLLEAAVASKVVTISLDARVDGMHLARLPEGSPVAAGARYFLAIEAELGEAGVYDLVPRIGKIASWIEIPRYLEGAASAVPLTACLRPPRALPLRAGKVYFAIDDACAAWHSIVRERALAVHLPPPFEPRSTKVALFIIPEG